MYGLVNKAIEDLIVSEHGREAWEHICERAGFGDGSFIAMQSHDDAITYNLVGAICDELGAEPGDVLRGLGKWWITFTAAEGYGEMFSMHGEDLRSFLGNLGDMHDRVALTFPSLVPPRFELIELEENSYQFDYHSDREGLSSMVIGLLEGLALRFETTLDVQQIHTRAEQGFDRFILKEREAA